MAQFETEYTYKRILDIAKHHNQYNRSPLRTSHAPTASSGTLGTGVGAAVLSSAIFSATDDGTTEDAASVVCDNFGFFFFFRSAFGENV